MYNLSIIIRRTKPLVTMVTLLLLVVLLLLVHPNSSTSSALPGEPDDDDNKPPAAAANESLDDSGSRRHIHLESTCDGTLYRDLCVSTLATIPDLASKSLPEIISATVNHTIREVRASGSNCSAIRRHRSQLLSILQRRALADCLELFDGTVSQLSATIQDLNSYASSSPSSHRLSDLRTLLSAAMTNQYTCLEGFGHGGQNVSNPIRHGLHLIVRHVSNSLSLLNKMPRRPLLLPRPLLLLEEESRREFPAWMSRQERERLLQSNKTTYDLVVAKDGSGNFRTVREAVEAAPNSSATRFVIYIKRGTYFENVEVSSEKTMLMFVGDGIGKTVIKASRSVGTNWTTFRSATVAVVGNGFLAKGMTIENSAGPSGHQAVAVRSGSDLSAFYQCSFVGYQDTLYVHSQRQYYRECDIYGTVDFVFGDATAVLQNCNLYARKPNPGQKNIVTAQGREDPNQNTGISILNCKIAAASDLVSSSFQTRTYLGRPWREYSRTVILNSFMGDLIDPAGWLEWSGDFGLKTLYYGEYMNRGPGANTSARVRWPGYRVINTSAEAAQFAAEPFIQGSQWLPNTGFPYNLGLA